MKHLAEDTLQRIVDLTGFTEDVILAVHSALIKVTEEEIDYLFSKVTE